MKGFYVEKKSFNSGEVYHSDCLSVLAELPDNSIDSVVTDPPYGLSFMGRKWDYDVPSEEVWRECLRVLKPGGHLLAFAGTRTQHRMAVRIEDAGFEIRDMIAYVYGSGFPKSMDVSKAIDKAAGAVREKIPATGGPHKNTNLNDDGWCKIGGDSPEMDGPEPVTELAKKWHGWGTAIKPSLEPVTVARKPLVGTVAENVLEYGTGAINVEGCGVPRSSDDASGWSKTGSKASDNRSMSGQNYARDAKPDAGARWPANLIHDGSDEVVSLFPESNGSGSAARFFYCAKASKSERTHNGKIENCHPTVKPVNLMRYLVRLVTPKGGTVLDPFCGSGTTLVACNLEGMRFIGVEQEQASFETACLRAKDSTSSAPQFELDS